MKYLWVLFPSLLLAQSVPNGTIQPGQVWTTAQWNSAWQAKTDYTAIAPNSFLCNPTGASALPIVCTTGTGLSFSGSILNSAGGGSVTFSSPNNTLLIAGSPGNTLTADLTPMSAQTILGNSTSSTASPTALSSIPNAFILDLGTTEATGTTTERSLTSRAADVANVMDYGAFGDTTLNETASLNSTAGSPTISFGTTISGAFSGSTIVVGQCGTIIASAGGQASGTGLNPVTTTANSAGAQITAQGSGYAIGDTITLTGSGGAFTTNPIVTVIAIDASLTSVGNITAGTSYTTGIYTAVALTGGTGSGAQASITVVSGGVTSVIVTTAGTGYAIGDTLSASAANIGGTGSGFSATVNAIGSTGLVAQIAIGTAGAITTFPTGGAFTQSATSGSGTGFTTTLVSQALPLATTIASLSGTNVTLAANCSLSHTNYVTRIAWGHDDATAIQAALNSGKTKILFPTGHVYGIRSNLTTSNSHRYDIDGQGTTIVSLTASVTYMLNPGGGGFQFWPSQESHVHDMTLEGMGISEPLRVKAAGWEFDHLFLRNASPTNLYVDGSSLSINNHFHHLTIWNDPVILPNGCSGDLIQVSANVTDNQFDHIIANGCMGGGLVDGGGGGNIYDTVHLYAVGNNAVFLWTGPAGHSTNLYADTPYGNYAGFSITGNSHNIVGCYVYIASGQQGNSWNPYGVYIASGQDDNIVGCQFNGFPGGSLRGIVDTGGRTNNYITSNLVGGATSVVTNYQSTPTQLMLGFGTLGTAVTATGSTDYLQLGGGAAQNGEIKVRVISPYTGFLTGFYVASSGDIGNANTYTFNIVVNGTTTALGCVWTGSGSGNDSCNDTADQVAVTAGQPISIKLVTSASATGVSVYGGIKFVAFH